MMLAFGMVSALLAVKSGGAGQVIDCAMTDGSALLASLTWGLHASGLWEDRTGVNSIDGGAPYYDTYETADGKWIAIGAIEPQFWAVLRGKLGIADPQNAPGPQGEARRPLPPASARALVRPAGGERRLLRAGPVARRGAGASAQPGARHLHRVGGVTQPAPAPRYSGTPTAPPRPARNDADALLAELGYAPERIAALREAGTIA